MKALLVSLQVGIHDLLAQAEVREGSHLVILAEGDEVRLLSGLHNSLLISVGRLFNQLHDWVVLLLTLKQILRQVDRGSAEGTCSRALRHEPVR